MNDFSADDAPGSPHSALMRRLLAESAASSRQLVAARERAATQNLSLLEALLQDPGVRQQAVAQALSRETGLPLLDLDAFEPDTALLREPHSRQLMARRLLPLRRQDGRLLVALADPHVLAPGEADGDAALLAVLVEYGKLMLALRHHDGETPAPGATASRPAPAPPGDGGEDESAVRLIDRVLGDAIAAGASDVHFEPFEQQYRIRRRLDGELRVVATPPASMAPRLAARLKVMAGLDLAERRLPQDGRIAYHAQTARGSRGIDLRVATCPTLHGEKICCRILDPASMPLDIDGLGYESRQRQAYLQALAQPQGLILVTGPTGSGKTVSLYAGLKHLNTEARNIATAEDPAEITLPGVNQLNIHPKAGLNFATALRAFLRQDPDVIMVGEIRDLETAEIAIKAAQTGHLVLSTLHTNDAPQTVVRLLNMGVPAYNLASTLSLIIAQRLARKLCAACRRAIRLPQDELLRQGFTPEEIAAPDFQLFEATGCTRCDEGYAGRTGVFQVMPFSEEMGRLLMRGADARALADQAAREQVMSLRRAALRKAAAGVIDLQQAYACTVDG